MKTLYIRCMAIIIVFILVLTSLPAVLMAEEDNDGDADYVVTVNYDAGYTTLQEAMAAAVDGDTLTLVQDIFLAGPFAVNIPGCTITLNLAGHCLRLYDAAENAAGEGGDADTGSGGMFVLEAGSLVVVDEIFGAPQRGSVQSTNASWPAFWLEGDNGAAYLQIEGGVFGTTDAGCIGLDETYGDVAVSISGGNFDRQQPEEYLAAGYAQILMDDGTYEVEPVTTYTITWQDWDGTVLETDAVNEGDTPQYYGDTPFRPEDDAYTYEFAGWDQEVVPAESDAVYTAVYNAIPKPQPVPAYTITWQDWDGTVLETDAVDEGDTPQYYGDTPFRPEDDTYTYEFAGWDQEVVPAESDAVYTAVYNAIPKPQPVPVYTITWQNWDGTVLQAGQTQAGAIPEYTGATPVRPVDSQYTYTFAGWQPQPVPASANTVYTATFASQAVPVPVPGFTSSAVTLYTFTSGQAQEGYPVLYQEGTTDNPYIDLAAAFSMVSGWYQDAGTGISFTTAYSSDSGSPVFTAARENGTQAIYDLQANTLTFMDFEGFTDYADVPLHVYRNGHIQRVPDSRVYPHKAETVTVSLSDYGFSGSDVNGTLYLPMAAFSGIFLAPAGMNWICTGQEAYIVDGSDDQTVQNDQGFSINNRILASIGSERSQAGADTAYQELCLALNLYCGYKTDLGVFSGFDGFFQETGLYTSLAGTSLDDYKAGLAQLSEVYLANTSAEEAANGYEENGNMAVVTAADFCSLLAEPYEQDPQGQPLLTYANQQITRQDSPITQVVIDLTSSGGDDMAALLSVVGWVLGQADLAEQTESSGAGHVTSWQADIDLDGQITENDYLDLNTYAVYVLTGPGTRAYGNAAAAILKASGNVSLLGQATGGGDSRLLSWTSNAGDILVYPGTSRIAVRHAGIYESIPACVEPNVYIRNLESLKDRNQLAELLSVQ